MPLPSLRARYVAVALVMSVTAIGTVAACLGDDPEKANPTDGTDEAGSPNPNPGDGGLTQDGEGELDASCVDKDFQNDKRHCGGCNHNCLQGDCEAGACSSWQVTSIGLGGQKETISGIDVNPEDNKIYFALGPNVWRVKPDGSEQEILVSIGDGGVGSPEFTGVVRRPSGMFACTTQPDFQAGVVLLPIAANGPLNVQHQVGECNGMTSKGNTVYVFHSPWIYAATSAGSALLAYLPDGGAPTSDIDVDNDYFYWVNGDRGLLRGKISGPVIHGERVDRLGDGGNPEAIREPRGLAVVGKYAYVSEAQSLSRIDLDAGTRAILWSGERAKPLRGNQHMAYDRKTGALYFGVAGTVRGLVPPIPPP
jgi:hypothetical protein